MPLDGFASTRIIVREVSEIVRPPRRISVSDAAKENMRIESPGGYSGPWDPTLTPYMIEPMDELKSRCHKAVVLVAPARCGKTQGLLDGWLTHCVTADPGDMGLYFSTQTLAYDYRKRRMERLHKYSPAMHKKLSKRAHDTTIEMISYRHGMILNIGWPTSSQLAQRDLRYVALTDYDSFPDDIDGEGSAFDLAGKRVQVAMSAGMALAESSPKRLQTSATWRARTDHEAPPTDGGILPLYNRGDRRRWYWQCMKGCRDWFEAPALPQFDESDNIEIAAASAHIACPNCGQVYRSVDKKTLNVFGRWVPDGVRIDSGGEFHGEPNGSQIASFWLLGSAAAFQTWRSMVSNYLIAKRCADDTGDETALATTINVDQGMPFRPRALNAVKGLSKLDQRRDPRLLRGAVPEDARCLIATVDVQGDRFEVGVFAHGVGNERWIVDRYAIHQTSENEYIAPAVMAEHWRELTRRVVDVRYPAGDGWMRVHAVAVDSGGQEGVSERAYAWWRKLRREKLHRRVFLVKGGSTKTAPMVKLTYPDATDRTARAHGGAGDVPVLLVNTDKVKDSVFNDLQRNEPGHGYVHIPDWLPDKILNELTAEQRTTKGWANTTYRRNETWDLLVYDRALWKALKGDEVAWDNPPPWLRIWSLNVNILENENPVRSRKSMGKTIGPQRKGLLQ